MYVSLASAEASNAFHQFLVTHHDDISEHAPCAVNAVETDMRKLAVYLRSSNHTPPSWSIPSVVSSKFLQLNIAQFMVGGKKAVPCKDGLSVKIAKKRVCLAKFLELNEVVEMYVLWF
jgi:hypothetical protein